MIKGGMGPRMIGEREFKISRIESVTVAKGFGMRMLQGSPLGDELTKARAELEAEAVVDVVTTKQQQDAAPEKKFYSVVDLKRILEEEPLRVGELFSAEQERPDGMRKTALRLMLAAAENREPAFGGPDVAIVSVLQEALASLDS